MPTSRTGSESGFTLLKRSAEHGFTHWRRSAQHGFTHGERSAEHGFTHGGRSAEHGFTHGGRSAEHGFTLVELMVVVAIIGMAAGAVVLSLPEGNGEVRRAAETLAARVTIARDLSIVGGRATALVVNGGGYTFAQRSGGVMRPLEQRGLREAALPGQARSSPRP